MVYRALIMNGYVDYSRRLLMRLNRNCNNTILAQTLRPFSSVHEPTESDTSKKKCPDLYVKEIINYRQQVSKIRKENFQNAKRLAQQAKPIEKQDLRQLQMEKDRKNKMRTVLKRAIDARNEAKSIAKSIYGIHENSVHGEMKELSKKEKRERARVSESIVDTKRGITIMSLNEQSKSWIGDEVMLMRRIDAALARPKAFKT